MYVNFQEIILFFEMHFYIDQNLLNVIETVDKMNNMSE